MPNIDNKKVVLVTGSAGFIGFHISKKLLDEGWRVIGIDCLSNYYDVSLKKDREAILLKNNNYISVHEKLEKPYIIKKIFSDEKPQVVIHLAAQAGVRHSIENPRAYLESNIIGTFELLEAAREYPPRHLLIASTSSAYGANKKMPSRETDQADHQISFYAATKKSTESMAHSYSHLFNIPTTIFRFFTVYGPWGRPDMALFKFTKAILNFEKIDVYNSGNMVRDFTYIDDLIKGIRLLMDTMPRLQSSKIIKKEADDGNSPVAPFRIVNIGNSKPEKLSDYISSLEQALGRSAIKNLLPMQSGDVSKTWADTTVLKRLTGYKPTTEISVGVSNFVKWYCDYYHPQGVKK